MGKLKQVAFWERGRHWRGNTLTGVRNVTVVSCSKKQQISSHFLKTVQLSLSEKACLDLDDRALPHLPVSPPPVFSGFFQRLCLLKSKVFDGPWRIGEYHQSPHDSFQLWQIADYSDYQRFPIIYIGFDVDCGWKRGDASFLLCCHWTYILFHTLRIQA